MKEKNIENIMIELVSLGVPAGIEHLLRMNICFQPDHFPLYYRLKNENDTLNTNFYFEKEEGDYVCRYYEACLRKEIEISGTALSEVDVFDLSERMAGLNWNIDLHRMPEETTQSTTIWAWGEAVENIVTDLKQLSVTKEGASVAERLKMKFWIDTPLASLISNINLLKSQVEIGQRFYFFDGEGRITLDEAYRFLSHKWSERQLNLRKKKEEEASKSINGKAPVISKKNSPKKRK